ncbi:hypothetical protein DFH29DRAFT_981528 [Suillus ampliporus]|nr:hypothetical protein DFH29DRAFT_981528 [Suillus ampliporus]
MMLIQMHDIDDIKVEYHPSSGRPTKVYHFEDYGCGPGAPTVVPKADPMPWQPFRTCIDFEVAELAHKAGLSHEQLDQLIQLIHCSRSELFTLWNCKDARDMWDAVSFKMTPFMKEGVVVPFRGIDQTFALFHHLLYFIFDAQRLSKFNGEKFIWFIHEPWTANAYWEYQLKIPPDAKPLAFILYANKAKLSSFGHVKGYPVVACCANLPTAVRNGKGLGGGHIVKEDKNHSGKPTFVNFKNVVWHASFLKILACLVSLLKFGSAIKYWDDVIHILYPIVLTLFTDYEEQVVMALIHGLMGKFPCPICLVPRNELSNTLNVYPLHTSTDTKALLARARESTTLGVREQILSSQSLCDVNSSFGVLEHTNVHRALSHDKLHFNDEGLFSDHKWPELQKWAAVQIDSFFQLISHWRNLNHFDQVISVSFSDGMKYEDISKLIIFAVHNLFDRDMDPEAYLLLCYTIKNGRETLSKLTELMDKYIEDTAEILEKSWNFPKKHLSAHVFDDIEVKGVSRNYSTKPNEKMHGPLKDAYQDHTNFKNFAEQETNEVDLTEPTDAQHFSLGSKQVVMSFADIEADSAGNPVFDRFRIKLNNFMNRVFAANSIPFPVLLNQIVECRFLKVNFESLTDTGVIFGKLMLIFTCTVGDVQYPVMLVLLYDQLVGVHSQKDKDFQFWHVKRKPRASAEFFSIHSIVRGCVIVEDASRPDEFLVVDTVDTDMFLQMKDICSQ